MFGVAAIAVGLVRRLTATAKPSLSGAIERAAGSADDLDWTFDLQWSVRRGYHLQETGAHGERF